MDFDKNAHTLESEYLLWILMTVETMLELMIFYVYVYLIFVIYWIRVEQILFTARTFFHNISAHFWVYVGLPTVKEGSFADEIQNSYNCKPYPIAGKKCCAYCIFVWIFCPKW